MGKRGNGEGSIYKLKSGRWRADLTIGFDHETGRQRRKTKTAPSRREAARTLDELKERYANVSSDQGPQTLKQYIETWLRNKESTVRGRTVDSYEATLKRHVLPILGDVPIEEIETFQLQQILDGVADRSGHRTSNYTRTVLNAAMNQAMKWRLISRNPLFGTVKKAENPREQTIWTPKQIRAFLAAARGHRLYALFYVALTTGLRKGELLGLTWEDVEPDAIRVVRSVSTRSGKVVESEPKSRSSRRVVTIGVDTQEVMKDHRGRQKKELAVFEGRVIPARVFTNELGETLDGSNVSKVWHRLQKKAGVPRARLHDARHMHLSLLIANGTDIRTVSDRAGHADTVLTLRQYSHALDAQRKRAAIPLEALLGEEP